MQVEPEICDSALRSSQQTSNQGSENDGLSPRTFGADAHQLVQVGPRSYEFLITGKPLESPDCPLPRIGMGPWMEHLYCPLLSFVPTRESRPSRLLL